MTDKTYSGLGSRIVLGTLKLASNSDDEDIFLSDSIADRPELRVQLKYFTVELKPSRNSVKNISGAKECRYTGTGSKSRSSLNGQKKAESGKSVSPNETTSSDSFHSCRSTTSIQELPCKGHVRNKTQFEKQVSKAKRTVIRDDDLLNHLTMVNAIFLSKSVSNTTQHESVNNKHHQENANNSGNTDSLSISRIPSSSNKVCSEAYSCQINHNPRVKYISKIYGNNIVTKPTKNGFDTLYSNLGVDRLSYTKTFSESFEPVLNSKKSGFEIVENVITNNTNDFATGLNEDLPASYFVQNKICSNVSHRSCKRYEIKVPEMKFAEIIPLCDESSLLVVLDQSVTVRQSNTDHEYQNQIKIDPDTDPNQKRRKTVPGCEDNLKFCTPKNSLSLISIESKDTIFDSTDIVHGDGDFTDYAYTENSGRRLNKMFFKNIDDTYLKMLINKSLKKIQNKSENNLRASESDESDIFESDEECDGPTDYKKVDMKKNNSNYSQPPLQLKKLKLQSCFQEVGQNRFRRDDSLEREDGYNSPLDEYDSDNNYSAEGPELLIRESLELESLDQAENGFGKRRIGERTRTLSVIQEESSEENEDIREDDLADDYCLIDSNGRPIHLFDNQGLPLTDNSGRPLRSSQGKLLMNCDPNGIPVVDEECSIFDMFGLQPHEARFDPSMAPKKAVCSKLSAGDGRPLLLFDAQGRPLTSVSGTMLVDSSGRGLVRLSTAEEHAI